MTITYNFYVDNEFATDFIVDEEHHSIREVFESDNPQFVDITSFDQAPNTGMIFNNGHFENGPNGETFVGNMEELMFSILGNNLQNFKVVAFLDNNIIKEKMFFNLNEEGPERTYAALMSSPTIEKKV